MKTIYLDTDQVPASLRGGYSGKKFKVVVTESVTVPSDAGLWSGGSRETYRFVCIATGTTVAAPYQNAAPWDNRRQELSAPLPEGIGLVCHTMFQGTDLGLTFYLRPENAQKLLSAAVELSEHQRVVLEATRSYKSSYGGQDRYQMARGDAYGEKAAQFPTRVQWEQVKGELIAGGYLNKAGAITTKGRNAL